MTTYNTYQEAKIANPDKEIIRFDKQDEFKAVGNDELSAYLTTWTKCNPADHCITVEKFLADGYKFEIGDICLDDEGQVINIDVEGHTWNKPDKFDVDRYVLQAAALEEKPTPTKFVKVEESIFDLKGEFERGELYSSDCEGHYTQLKCEKKLYLAAYQDSIYRKVEIYWTDELGSFLVKKAFDGAYVNNIAISDLNDSLGSVRFDTELRFNDFIEMCHLVALLTENPTNQP